MRDPAEAYREGYEKGRQDTLSDNVSEVLFGGLSDDPGGYYAAGYHDGAARKAFKFHRHGATDPREKGDNTPKASELEKAWYRLCDASEFITQDVLEQYMRDLSAEGNQAAIVVGLSDFTGHTCPKCSGRGQSRVHFLGSIKHPVCGWTGYMATGAYISHQVAQIFYLGGRAGAALKRDGDRKGDKSGGWLNGIFAFLFTAVFRALLSLVLIPLHTIIALCQPNQTRGDIAARVATLALEIFGLGVALFQAKVSSSGVSSGTYGSPSPAPPAWRATTSPSHPAPPSESEIGRSVASPSFDCSRARTSVEKLICRDARLAALDVEMVSAHRQALNRLPQNATSTFRKGQLEWFKNYSRTCGRSSNDDERTRCVADFLTARTTQLASLR